MKTAATLLLLSGIALAASADTLDQYLKEAAANNPQLAAARNQWKASGEKIAQQKSLPDPVISYAYFFEEVETRVGPQEQKFGIAQKFPSFGKRSLKKQAATESAAAEGERYRNSRLNLNAQVTRAYTDLWFLQRSIDITRERMRLMTDLEQVARTRYKTGGSMAPLTQAQMELGKLEERLLSLEDLREPLTASFNALLNRPADTPAPLPAPLPFAPLEVNNAQLFTELSRTSPVLAALHHSVQGEEQLEKLARREWLPDLTLGVQYIDTGEAAMPVNDSGKDPVIGTVSLNIPLWFGKNNARVREAGYRKTAARLRLENQQQTLQATIKKTLFELRDTARKINLYKDGLIPKAEQALNVTQQGYESGQLEFFNLIDAERQLLEFELSYERARADHLNNRAQLSLQSGIDFLTPILTEK